MEDIPTSVQIKCMLNDAKDTEAYRARRKFRRLWLREATLAALPVLVGMALITVALLLGMRMPTPSSFAAFCLGFAGVSVLLIALAMGYLSARAKDLCHWRCAYCERVFLHRSRFDVHQCIRSNDDAAEPPRTTPTPPDCH